MPALPRSTAMAEPTTSAAAAGAAGAAGWKLIGGAAGGIALAATLATIVVMCATRPKTDREWAVGIISTVVSSTCGGAGAVRWLGIQDWAYDPFGLVALIGLVFVAGLPGWALVRAVFRWIEKREGRDIAQILKELRK